MGLFKTRVDENWKINYIKEFNEMRSEYEKKNTMHRPRVCDGTRSHGVQFRRHQFRFQHGWRTGGG